jgi:membrane fusion protein, multidrug efflux system
VVGLREVDVGARVTDTTVLTRLDDLPVIELEFQVPELYFGAIRQGQPVDATSTAFPDTVFSGEVAAIDTRIDAVSRSFRVRAELPNPDARLPGGLFMLARITLRTRPDAILIPEQAVMAEGRSTFVYRIAGTPTEPRAERVEIRLGQRRVGEVEVAVRSEAAGSTLPRLLRRCPSDR